MRIIRAITLFLFPVLLGGIIGTAIVHNYTHLKIAIVLLVSDILIGIISEYFTEKMMKKRGIDTYLDYKVRVARIMIDPSASCAFTPAEIVKSFILLDEAKRNLSDEDYNYVLAFYNMFLRIDNKKTVNFVGFTGMLMDIIAHFDLIAPYSEFGVEDFPFEETTEKEIYRLRAKELLVGMSEKLPVGEKWMELHEEFMQKFYSELYSELEIDKSK